MRGQRLPIAAQPVARGVETFLAVDYRDAPPPPADQVFGRRPATDKVTRSTEGKRRFES